MSEKHDDPCPPGNGSGLRIGDWWVRPAEGLLERGGEAIRLRPRAMEVLALLVTRPGHAVSKEEIFAEVWEGNAVEDGALAHCISEIRSALGDTPRSPRYIETIPKRGYRLVAPVAPPPGIRASGAPAPETPALEAPATSGLAGLEPPAARSAGRRMAPRLAVLAGAAALILALWLAGAIDREAPAAAAAAADRRPRVAVLGFLNLSGEPEAEWLSTALSEMLTTELAVSEVVQPIPGESVARIQRELWIADADRLDDEALARLRTGLGADYVVVGSYLTSAGVGSDPPLRVDLRLQDRGGEIVAAVVESGTVGELADLALLAGLRLRRALGDEGDLASRRAPAGGRLPASPTAARLYYQGLLHLRRLEAAAATELLQRAATEEPEAPQIHFALAEAWSLLGYDLRGAEAADRALDLAAALPRENQLWVEARCHAFAARWDEAIERLRALTLLDPGNHAYGIDLARAQVASGRLEEALATIAGLGRRQGTADADPRIELLAAEGAAATGDHARSVDEAVRARELAGELGAPPVAGRALLLEARGLHALGRVEEAEAALEEARGLFAEVQDAASEASAAVTLAGWLWDRGVFDRSESLSREALGTFRAIGNRAGELEALRRVGRSVWRRGEAADGERMLLTALDGFRDLGDRRREASTLVDLGAAAAIAGGLSAYASDTEVCGRFEQALAIFRELNDRDGIVEAVNGLGRCALIAGDVAQASRALDEAVALARQLGTPEWLGSVLYQHGLARGLAGDLAAAEADLEEAIRLFRELDNPQPLGAALSTLGSLRILAGDLGGADELLEESLRWRRRSGDPVRTAYTLCYLARLRLDQGRIEEAEPLVREAVALAGVVEAYADDARLELAFVLLESGRPEAARVLLEAQPRLFDLAASADVPLLSGRITLGRVLAATGEVERGRALLAEVVAAAEERGLTLLRLEAELARFEIEDRAGLGPPARRRLQAFAEQSRGSGLISIARRAEALLAGAARLELSLSSRSLPVGSREGEE